ncbi:MAG TPA: aminotransferase class V-fold PLP-dependent enzyme [Thermoanaerobaculia bacterium]|nr:aminotransferase class V-fold PLP-dependent enzyme [Thermoanaerobaculia bacterium]
MAAIGLWPFTKDIAPSPTHAMAWPAATDPHFWRWVRGQFDIPRDEAYFNTGTLGAVPRPVMEILSAHMREIEKTIAHYDYRPEHPEYFSGYRKQEELRAKIATLFNATGPEIALTQNATMGTNFVANGLNLQPGDEVLMTDQEHVGNRGPWELREKRQGIVLRKLPIGTPPPDPDSVVRVFADAITPRTRAIDVPQITSKLGIVMPVARIAQLARDKNIFFLVDGAQVIGQKRIDVKAIGCDAYTTSPHKWLLAPPGNGLLFVRSDRQKELWPTLASASWNDYEPNDGVFRLMQYGTGNLSLLVGLDAAIDFHQHIGADRIEQRVMELSNRLRDGLKKIDRAKIYSPTHPEMTCGIVTWGLDGVKGPDLMDGLWNRRKIRVRSVDEGMVRQSTHLYNSPEEVDATLEIARSF